LNKVDRYENQARQCGGTLCVRTLPNNVVKSKVGGVGFNFLENLFPKNEWVWVLIGFNN
jgi:hypothetical protein